MVEPDGSGFPVAVQQEDWIYMAGQGASPEGNLPFVDRRSLTDLRTERLWRCEKGSVESPAKLISNGANKKPKLITRHESLTEPPNYFQRDLETGNKKQLTHSRIRHLKFETSKRDWLPITSRRSTSFGNALSPTELQGGNAIAAVGLGLSA